MLKKQQRNITEFVQKYTLFIFLRLLPILNQNFFLIKTKTGFYKSNFAGLLLQLVWIIIRDEELIK
jgi:hypothetical protein